MTQQDHSLQLMALAADLARPHSVQNPDAKPLPLRMVTRRRFQVQLQAQAQSGWSSSAYSADHGHRPANASALTHPGLMHLIQPMLRVLLSVFEDGTDNPVTALSMQDQPLMMHLHWPTLQRHQHAPVAS